MLHYIHQLASDFVCLLFGAEQVAYIFNAFLLIQLPAVLGNKVDKSSEWMKKEGLNSQSKNTEVNDNKMLHIGTRVNLCDYSL